MQGQWEKKKQGEAKGTQQQTNTTQRILSLPLCRLPVSIQFLYSTLTANDVWGQ